MSNVRRLLTTDRIFFLTVNLRRKVEPFGAPEYTLMIDVLKSARQRLGFLLCGYVLMPDHWHALISTAHPLTISQVVHDVKKVAARRLHRRRGTEGPVWQHQFWDRSVRHEKELAVRFEYMHLNPVKKGLVRKRVATVSVVLTVGSLQGRIPTDKKALSVATKPSEFGGACSHSQGFSDCGVLRYVSGAMSHIHRLRTTDRVFYVTVNLRRSLETFDTLE